MQPYQQRIVDEKKELDEKIDRLRAFIHFDPAYGTISDDERTRLARQLSVMEQYSSILSQRIAAF